MFRFFRHPKMYERIPHVIPMTLNYYDADRKDFVFINSFSWADKIKLRGFYINDNHEIVKRYQQTATYEGEILNPNISNIVQEFFSEVFEHMLGLK